ncbi:hypothetical protein MKC73_02405 [[Clostridium] innocuum]|nr:hypothetical protein [[Clostridium] innocuum]MCR0350220.1 hypothetical protein [[Clostridium] innocuum]RJV83248.1 hypothetical protein DWX45_20430 [Erysipelotrichaceae bacterium AF19-24AC]RJV86155.1 hypothetical protein DWW36_13840 [Erysipelotrichaceae bacterium AF15-26LB]
MYQVMYYGGLVIGISGLIATVIVFVKMDLHQAFLEISGLEAKHAMKQMQETGKQKGLKTENHVEIMQEHTKTIPTDEDTRQPSEMETTMQLGDEGETILLEKDVVNFYVEEEYAELHTEEVIKERDGTVYE